MSSFELNILLLTNQVIRFLPTFILFLYFLLIIFTVVAVFRRSHDKTSALRKLKAAIGEKLKASIPLTANELSYMADGAGVPRNRITKCLSQIFNEQNDPSGHTIINTLLVDLESIKPFEDLPNDVKPSIIRIQEIVALSGQPNDIHALDKIRQFLSLYTKLKLDFEKDKKINRLLRIATVVGTLSGFLGLYLSFKTPDLSSIETVVNSAIQNYFQKNPSNNARTEDFGNSSPKH